MILKDIFISNFRNYDQLTLSLNPGINIIYGNNAQGKTNLLESIYVLAVTKSHRSFIDHNLIKDGLKESKIKGTIEIDQVPTNLEIHLTQKDKTLKIDQDEVKKVSDYISKMNIIIFYPEDLYLIKGSPAERRRYLNLELSQLDHHYLTLITDYNKLLKMRNDYLKKMMKELDVDDTYLEIVTNYLIDKAVIIYKMRMKFIQKLNEKIGSIYQNIMNLSNFYLVYKASIELDDLQSETLKQKLKDKFQKMSSVEKKLGTTMVGPHRDDFDFYLGDLNLRNYGSQGQQRVAILALKLAEIEIFRTYRGTNPILLLDDVFSELDDQKKNNLLSYIHDQIQAIITTTDLKNISKKTIKQSKLIKIEDGNVIKIKEVDENGRKE